MTKSHFLYTNLIYLTPNVKCFFVILNCNYENDGFKLKYSKICNQILKILNLKCHCLLN